MTSSLSGKNTIVPFHIRLSVRTGVLIRNSVRLRDMFSYDVWHLENVHCVSSFTSVSFKMIQID